MKRPSALQLALAAAFVSWLLSTYIHHPMVEGNIYSDVVSFWHVALEPNRGKIPCVNYFFEYPPAACYTLYAAAALGGWSLETYYLAFAILSLPAYLALGWAISRYADDAAAFFVLAPSIVVYGVYNFDHFFAALTALALAFLKDRERLAYFLLGLGAAFKLFTAILLPALLLSKNRRSVLDAIKFFMLGAIPAAAPVVALNPSYVADFIGYHSGWGIENSWTVWLSSDPFSQSAKLLGYMVAVVLLLRSYMSTVPETEKGFMVFAAWLIGAHVFTPQMALWLIPFVAAIRRIWPWMPLFEASNAAIIFTWFWTDTPTMPWTPPQTMAALRAVALSAMWLTAYRSQPLYRRVGV
jgi:hypothetical protein